MKEKNISFKKTILYILKWLALGLIMGVVCGGVGTLFAKAISLVTDIRNVNGWIVYLLPLGGIVSVFLYKLLKTESVSTELILESIQCEKEVPARIIPAIFSATLISQAFGASAGKEGAALQLGGGFAAIFTKLFKLDEKSRKILTACGMGAFFAALFGTPFGTCVFAIEVAIIGKMFVSAFVPTFIACITAAKISAFFGVEGEHFAVPNLPDVTFISFIKVIVIAVAGLIVSLIFCKLIALCEEYFPKFIKNPYLRIIIGSAVLVGLTLLVGTSDYNGTGVHVIHRIMNGGEVSNIAFVLKILFTVISVSCGFKGGEIVPTFFVGASLGTVLAPLLGLDSVFCAAIGMVALFCGATKCPLATLILAVEMFGYKGALFFLTAVIFSFLPIRNTGLYQSQKFILK